MDWSRICFHALVVLPLEEKLELVCEQIDFSLLSRMIFLKYCFRMFRWKHLTKEREWEKEKEGEKR